MQITILSLFPEMFVGPFAHSIVKRAGEDGYITIKLVNIRDYGSGKHKMVDDTAYGGGIGMVMKVDVLHSAIEANRLPGKNEKVILLSASGAPFTQEKAKSYASIDHLMLVCGHYEGVDARVLSYIDEEVSIGDFITTGGEIPAMLITDAVVRLVPGVLKVGATDAESYSLQDETNSDVKLLEYPHYTKPAVYEDVAVPEVLLSGDHEKIKAWRTEEARKKTAAVRPDLLKKLQD